MSETSVAAHRTHIQVNGRQPEVVDNIVDENMIAILALAAKDKGGPELECQIALWPAADSSFTAKYADGYLWLQA